MSRATREEKRARSPGDKRSLDVRRGILLAHVALEIALVIGAKLGWYTILVGEKTVAHVIPGDALQAGAAPFQPFTSQAQALILVAVIAFFFTSYDLVTNSDIQWPPLLASAFALGCCGQVCYTLNSKFETITSYVLSVEEEARRARLAAKAQASPSPAATVSPSPIASGSPAATPSGTASVSSGSVGDHLENDVRLRLDAGLKLAIFASASMAFLSTYLTFFARRDT